MEGRRVKILPSVTQQIGAGTGNNYLTSKPILLTVMPHQFSSSFLLKETSRDAAHGLSLLTSPVNVKTAVLKHCFIFLDYYNKLLQTKWFIITEMHFFSQFQKLEVQNKDSGKAMLSLKDLGCYLSLPPHGWHSLTCPSHLCYMTLFSLCLCMAFL